MSIGEKVIRDSLFTTGQTIAQLLRSLAIIPLITNLLGAGNYGIWTTLFSIIVLVRSTGGVHLHGSLIRYSTGTDATRRVYSDTLFLTLLLAFLAGGTFLFAGSVLDVRELLGAQAIDTSNLVLLSAGIIVSDMLLQISLNFPRALGNVRRYEVLRTVRMLIETAALLAVFINGGGIVSGLLALLLISSLGNIILFVIIASTYGLARPSPSRFFRYLQYGAPMIPQELSRSILSRMDRFLLLYFLSPTAAGIYSVAYSISSLLQRFTTVLNSTLYPTVTDAWDDGKMTELKTLYGGIFRYTTILAVPALFGITLLSEQLLSLISTQKIANQGAFLVPILAAGFLINAYEDPVDYILSATEQTNKIGLAVGFAATMNLLLNILLIPRYNLLGAAAATLASEISITIIIYYFAGRELPISFPTRTLLAALGSAAIMSLVLQFLPTIPSAALHVVVYALVGSVSYFAVMVSVGEFSPREIYGFICS